MNVRVSLIGTMRPIISTVGGRGSVLRSIPAYTSTSMPFGMMRSLCSGAPSRR